MVNWRDPAIILRDNLILTKLLHALASVYIWETVFTAGFELDVLRGKRPYKWTIWIYLGTRYTCLLTFIVFFVVNDGGQVPCQPLVITDFALSYASWAFASLIIVLRVVAIWKRNTIASSIALSAWLVGLGLNIRTLTMIEAAYDPVFQACVALNTHRSLSSAVAILAIDTLLLVMMLIGLLRYVHRSSTGIWYLLYKQCIIWIIFAAIAEIPAVVFLSLNLNDAWNQMFSAIAITILAICAARMYRSLSNHGSLTEYSSDPPEFSAELPLSNYQRREPHGIHITTHYTTTGTMATMAQSDRTTAEQTGFKPAGQIRPEFVPGASNTTLAVPANTKTRDVSGYQIPWPHPG